MSGSMLWKYLDIALKVYAVLALLAVPVLVSILRVSARMAREEEYKRFEEWWEL